MPVILGIAIILVAVIIGQFVQLLLRKQNSRATEALADVLELKYTEELQPALPVVKGNYLLFAQGIPYSRQNVMEGLYKGMDLAVYSYTFALNLGRVQEHYTQTVIQFRDLPIDIPQFTLYPHDKTDAILATLVSKESQDSLLDSAGVRFPDHPDFRKQFKLIGIDHQKLKSLFDKDSVVDAIETIDVKQVQGLFCMEGSDANLFIYPLHKRIPVRFLQEFIENSIQVVQQMGLLTGE
jgi:hypothetical protein